LDYRIYKPTTTLIVNDRGQIALETEVDNFPSLRIYENLGFLRTKRLHRYYLNGNTAFRLVLYLKPGIPYKPTVRPEYQGPQHEAGDGLMGEDLLVRQAAQMRIEDIEGERHDVAFGSHG
jgi:N-alpha-acetyltransferase 30